MNKILEVLGRNATRLIANESQDAVGRRGQIAQKTVSNIVNAKNVRLTALEGLARALRVPPFTLIIDGDFSTTDARAIEHLIYMFLECAADGRRQIIRIAEAEARIATLPSTPGD